jgi:hypothetical protein
MHGLWVSTTPDIFLQRGLSVFDVPVVQISISTSECPKNYNICKHTEKIDKTTGMAILQGPIPFEISVVHFCTLFGVATSQKITHSGPPAH